MLDVGCGTGDLGRLAPPGGCVVYGVDGDPAVIEVAKAYERATVCQLDSARLPFEDTFFDGAVAKDVIEHVAVPANLAMEIHRVLRPGARLVVSVPMPKPSVVWNDYTHVRGFTRFAIRQLLEDFGFRVLQISRMGSVPGAGRFGFLDWTPTLLRLPGLSGLARSFEVVAERLSPLPSTSAVSPS